MTALLQYLPIVVGVLLAVGVIATVVTLVRRRLHPRELLLRSASAGSSLAILGLVGIVPAALWWAPWLLILALLAGIVIAARRMLRADGPAPEPPGRVRLVIEVGLWIVLLAIAVAILV